MSLSGDYSWAEFFGTVVATVSGVGLAGWVAFQIASRDSFLQQRGRARAVVAELHRVRFELKVALDLHRDMLTSRAVLTAEIPALGTWVADQVPALAADIPDVVLAVLVLPRELALCEVVGQAVVDATRNQHGSAVEQEALGILERQIDATMKRIQRALDGLQGIATRKTPPFFPEPSDYNAPLDSG